MCTYTSAGIFFDLTSSREGKPRGFRKICYIFIYNIPDQLFEWIPHKWSEAANTLRIQKLSARWSQGHYRHSSCYLQKIVKIVQMIADTQLF